MEAKRRREDSVLPGWQAWIRWHPDLANGITFSAAYGTARCLQKDYLLRVSTIVRRLFRGWRRIFAGVRVLPAHRLGPGRCGD